MSVESGYLPNFSSQGYQIDRELGRNNTGGRVVYLAHTLTEPTQPVVVKQFQFAKGAGWSEFKEIDREMQVLQDLKCQGIPCYLESFATDDGYCIVQEYIKAEPLSKPRSYEPDEIKQIALSLLEILVYLQGRIPLVIHRDIKPENVLVDGDLNVYLIDFGFARIGGGEVAMSSVAAGTFGFMSPEQIYNKGLTAGTDLYGLGATLIALLTNTRSSRMDELIDEDGKIDFRHLTPELSIRFLEWLETMVAPKIKDRYANAKAALEALEPIYVVRYPTLEFNQPSLAFKATAIGERITQSIEIINTTPDTIFRGAWAIEPHPNDSKNLRKQLTWISFSSIEIEGIDRIVCDIIVDTGKLKAQSSGTRLITFHSNAVPENNSLTLEIETAPLPVQVKQLPYESMIGLFVFALLCGLNMDLFKDLSNIGNSCIAGFFAVLIFTGVKFYSLIRIGNGRSFINPINDVLISTMIGCLGSWIAGGGYIGGIISGTLGAFLCLITREISLGIQPFIGCIVGAILSIATGILARNDGVFIASTIIGTHAGILATINNINYMSLTESKRHTQGFIFLMLGLIGILGINIGATFLSFSFLLLLVDACILALSISLIMRPNYFAQKAIQDYKRKEKYLTKL